MATVEGLLESANAIIQGVSALNAKLDEVATYIESLKGGASAEQVEELSGLLSTAKEELAAVLTEADGLDGTPVDSGELPGEP